MDVVLLCEWTLYPNYSVSMKNNIVNLSSKILTSVQTIILNKGLSFCLSETKIDMIIFCPNNEQSTLPVAQGGLGLSSAVNVSLPAYASSLSATRQLVGQILQDIF